MTLKIAVLAPMPSAKVKTATTVNPGACASRRRTCFKGPMAPITDVKLAGFAEIVG
jgi:hypothetical protein